MGPTPITTTEGFITDPRAQAILDAPTMYIDGAWEPGEAETWEKVNPTTGTTLSELRLASEDQVSRAIAAARRSQDSGVWPSTSPAERSRKLYELVDRLDAERSFLQEVLVADVGAPVALAESRQIGGMLGHLRWFAEAALRGPDGWYEKALSPDVAPSGAVSSSVLVREPIGVVAALPTFNYPYTNLVWKLGAALAAGCSVVVQPSSRGALSVRAFWSFLDRLELPPGVVNLVFGEESGGRQLSTADEVDMVSFTGSAAVGGAVMAQGGPSVKKVVLELGGKSACILLPGADIEAVTPVAINRLMSNTGQACGATSRLLVQEDDLERFGESAVKHMSSIVVGDPRDRASDLGPLIDGRHRGFVEGYVERALEGGAEVLARGEVSSGAPQGGFFMPPLLLTGVSNRSELCQEELFGPVGAVLTYGEVDEAVAIANDSTYGLNAGVFGPTSEALRVARRIRSGTVVVNGGGRTTTAAPWGGFRRSGTGREAGDEGFREFFEIKHIQVGWA